MRLNKDQERNEYVVCIYASMALHFKHFYKVKPPCMHLGNEFVRLYFTCVSNESCNSMHDIIITCFQQLIQNCAASYTLYTCKGLEACQLVFRLLSFQVYLRRNIITEEQCI